jgi:hypothetical protein
MAMYQKNGAPMGYGQQNGESMYLDRPERSNTMPVGEPMEYQDPKQQQRQAKALMAMTQAPTGDDQRLGNALQALVGRFGGGMGRKTEAIARKFGDQAGAPQGSPTGNQLRAAIGAAGGMLGGMFGGRGDGAGSRKMAYAASLRGGQGDPTQAAPPTEEELSGLRSAVRTRIDPRILHERTSQMARDLGWAAPEPLDPNGAAMQDYLGSNQGPAAMGNLPMGSQPGSGRPSEAVALGEGMNFGRMKGYDRANWENGMNSAKYNAGKILSKYAASPTGLGQAVGSEEFQRYFPGAKVTGSAMDEIDFGDLWDDHSGTRLGVIDVGENFDPNNPDAETAFGWDLKGLAAQAQGRPMMQGLDPGLGSQASSDPMLAALLGGDGGSAEFAQLMQLLLQGNGQPSF